MRNLKFIVFSKLTNLARKLPDSAINYRIVEYFWNKEWF